MRVAAARVPPVVELFRIAAAGRHNLKRSRLGYLAAEHNAQVNANGGAAMKPKGGPKECSTMFVSVVGTGRVVLMLLH